MCNTKISTMTMLILLLLTDFLKARASGSSTVRPRRGGSMFSLIPSGGWVAIIQDSTEDNFIKLYENAEHKLDHHIITRRSHHDTRTKGEPCDHMGHVLVCADNHHSHDTSYPIVRKGGYYDYSYYVHQ